MKYNVHFNFMFLFSKVHAAHLVCEKTNVMYKYGFWSQLWVNFFINKILSFES